MLESDYLDFTAPVPAESREHWKPENDDHMVTADGEIVPGVTVTEQPDKFVCEVI